MGFVGNLAGQKAVAAQKKQDYAAALKLYREAMEKGMDRPALVRNYGYLLVRQGQFDEALEILARAEKLSGNSESDRSDIIAYYAIALWKKGRLPEAVDLLKRRLAHGNNSTLYSVLGFLMIETGDADAALEFNAKALDYDPEDPIFLDNMGQTYYRLLQDGVKARRCFEKALEKKPNAIDTNYCLALMALDEGRKEEAKQKLETALKGNFTPLNYATPEKIRSALERCT